MSGDDSVLAAYLRRYDRVYDAAANAQAIAEQDAQTARRARWAACRGETPAVKRDT
jgi:hypothetical protein